MKFMNLDASRSGTLTTVSEPRNSDQTALNDALEREAATRQILQVISRSRDDEKPVFDAILENAARLCKSTMARLHLLNEAGTHHLLAAHWGEVMHTLEIGETWSMDDPLPIPRSIREARTIQVEDMAETELYRSGDPVTVRMVDEEGLRTGLRVPLMQGDRAFGCIALSRREVRPFTDDEIALVQTFADQAVIAIENVRQFQAAQTANTELETQLQREAAAREVLQVISQSRDDEQPVFDVILKNAARLCRSTMARLHLIEDDRKHRRLAAHWGEDLRALAIGEKMPMNKGHPISISILEARIIHIEDISETDLYKGHDPLFRRLVEKEGIRTLLTVPLLLGGHAFGCIALSRRERSPFAKQDIELVETFAAQAVIAIENVHQFRELESLNAQLESRVEDQVGEIERMGRLKRFLPSAVADAVVSSGSEAMLESHRALIGILFCDIRGFTAFCEQAEPEETIEVLQIYHEEMGKLISVHKAGVDHRMGDGIMVLFNDPVPCDDPAGEAVRLAVQMRARMAALCREWRKAGHRLGFGVGISLGYATVGMVGSEGRYEYTASGTAVNLAARLCDQAADGEILLSPRAFTAVEEDVDWEPGEELKLKGLAAPVEVRKVRA